MKADRFITNKYFMKKKYILLVTLVALLFGACTNYYKSKWTTDCPVL